MAQTERFKSATIDLFQLGGKPFESLMGIHKELLETLEQVQRDRLHRTMEEGKLASDLAARVASARSIPEVMALYQEWISTCSELFAEDGRKFVTDSQKVANVALRLLANGRGDVSK
jgi:hypothetical protein